MPDDRNEFEKLNERTKPKLIPWQDFESEVTAYLDKQIRFGNFGLNPATARVLPSPKYFSKLRESYIAFDVSIEVWPFPEADRPTLIWLWECKDYPARNVTVDEVEEFHDKMTQVGAHKGTIVTRKGFASGAIKLAKSYGIALIALVKEQITGFAFSQDVDMIDEVMLKSSFCLYSFGDEVSGPELNTLIQFEFTKAGIVNW